MPVKGCKETLRTSAGTKSVHTPLAHWAGRRYVYTHLLDTKTFSTP